MSLEFNPQTIQRLPMKFGILELSQPCEITATYPYRRRP